MLSAGDNWPEFRGPNGNGVSDATNLPVTFGETENLRWKTAIHDKGWSSPVVWGDQIWMTTGTADGKDLFVVCVDFNTGQIKHDFKLFHIDEPQTSKDFNSYASPTPAIEAGRVYVHFGSPGTAAIDTTTGKLLWKRQDLPCNHFRGAGSSPILVDNLLILTFDGFDYNYLVALDKRTGETVWKRDRNIDYGTDNGDYHKAFSTPQVINAAGRRQLVSPSAVATIAYDPSNGDELMAHPDRRHERGRAADFRQWLDLLRRARWRNSALRGEARRLRRYHQQPRRLEMGKGGPLAPLAGRAR